MKKILCVALACLFVFGASGQNYQRNGKEFSFVKKERTSSGSPGKKTGYTWKDSKGNVYDIYISDRGSCYIMRKSSKTGKVYKSYLPKEVSAEISAELKK